jgi:dihydrofolate reductase
MSLDGFIAGPNEEADWIIMDPSRDARRDFEAMFSQCDRMLMGRRSFEFVKRAGGGGSTPDMQVFVFSRTLRQPVDLAFLAMTHYQLGHRKEAEELLKQLRELMQTPLWSTNKEAQSFLGEAEALIKLPKP